MTRILLSRFSARGLFCTFTIFVQNCNKPLTPSEETGQIGIKVQKNPIWRISDFMHCVKFGDLSGKVFVSK